MNEINSLIEEIKDLEHLISSWKTMISKFPEDSFLAFALPPYEQRLKALRQALQALKKEDLALEVA